VNGDSADKVGGEGGGAAVIVLAKILDPSKGML